MLKIGFALRFVVKPAKPVASRLLAATVSLILLESSRANPSFQHIGNTLVMSNVNVRLVYNLNAGTTDFYWQNTKRISAFYSGVGLNTGYIKGINYSSWSYTTSSNQAVSYPLPNPTAPGGATPTLIWQGGNATVQPERATSWTGGLDFAPPWISGLTFGLTWLLNLSMYLRGGIERPGVLTTLQFQMMLPAFSAILLGLRWFPETPTMAEARYPGVELDFWVGLLAPAGTPQPALARLHEEFVKALTRPVVA